MLYDCTFMRQQARGVRFIETESRMVISKGWLVELGEESYRLMDIEFQFYERKRLGDSWW